MRLHYKTGNKFLVFKVSCGLFILFEYLDPNEQVGGTNRCVKSSIKYLSNPSFEVTKYQSFQISKFINFQV